VWGADTWLQLTDDVASDSLSDHQARSVTLQHPYKLPEPSKASSAASVRLLQSGLVPALLLLVSLCYTSM
jgi:hypothetical protein